MTDPLYILEKEKKTIFTADGVLNVTSQSDVWYSAYDYSLFINALSECIVKITINDKYDIKLRLNIDDNFKLDVNDFIKGYFDNVTDYDLSGSIDFKFDIVKTDDNSKHSGGSEVSIYWGERDETMSEFKNLPGYYRIALRNKVDGQDTTGHDKIIFIKPDFYIPNIVYKDIDTKATVGIPNFVFGTNARGVATWYADANGKGYMPSINLKNDVLENSTFITDGGSTRNLYGFIAQNIKYSVPDNYVYNDILSVPLYSSVRMFKVWGKNPIIGGEREANVIDNLDCSKKYVLIHWVNKWRQRCSWWFEVTGRQEITSDGIDVFSNDTLQGIDRTGIKYRTRYELAELNTDSKTFKYLAQIFISPIVELCTDDLGLDFEPVKVIPDAQRTECPTERGKGDFMLSITL